MVVRGDGAPSCVTRVGGEEGAGWAERRAERRAVRRRRDDRLRGGDAELGVRLLAQNLAVGCGAPRGVAWRGDAVNARSMRAA
eukprot:1952538-Prymnesium_polylepis.1